MKVQRKILLTLSWILLSVNICTCAEEEEEKVAAPPKRETFPRLFGIFSRPGDKTTSKQEGGSIVDHLGNVFQGGSIGFQVEGRPLAPFHGLIDRVKDVNPLAPFQGIVDRVKDVNPLAPFHGIVDKARDFIPIPSIPGLSPSPKDKNTDRKDSEVKPKPEDQWESENAEPSKTEVPDSDNSKFENMDEDGKAGEEEEADYTTEPIENIIQPRIRQKRSPESKVFHVPLQFLSNAKPFEVKIK